MTHEPGRELDALVAEKVMGWTGVHLVHGGTGTSSYYVGRTPRGVFVVRPYSTDIAAAWQVIEAMRQRNYYAEISEHISDPERQCAMFASRAGHYDSYERCWENEHQVCTATAPHAICLAALKAVGAIE